MAQAKGSSGAYGAYAYALLGGSWGFNWDGSFNEDCKV